MEISVIWYAGKPESNLSPLTKRVIELERQRSPFMMKKNTENNNGDNNNGDNDNNGKNNCLISSVKDKNLTNKTRSCWGHPKKWNNIPAMRDTAHLGASPSFDLSIAFWYWNAEKEPDGVQFPMIIKNLPGS